MQPDINDPEFLRTQQYKDASNLSARIRLHRDFSTNPQDYPTWLFDQMLADFPRDARILELGCGPGTLWAQNIGRIPPGWRITLSDFSEGMLLEAHENLAAHSGRFALRNINANDLPFPDRSFDVVMAHFMLYHVPDQARTIREVHRILKPAGVLHAMTLGENHMQELNTAIYGTDQPDVAARNFGLESGPGLLSAAFREVRQIDYPDSLEVTDLEALVDYASSMRVMSMVDDATFGLVRERLTTAYESAYGRFHITKQVGLLVASGYA
jgi:SAM-dependent methyltransferase